MKIYIGKYKKKGGQTSIVRIDNWDTWSLYYTLARIIYPCLVKFKESNAGYPGSMTEQEWDEILDKMILSFKMILDEEDDWKMEINETIQEGLDLFGKWYRSLWS